MVITSEQVSNHRPPALIFLPALGSASLLIITAIFHRRKLQNLATPLLPLRTPVNDQKNWTALILLPCLAIAVSCAVAISSFGVVPVDPPPKNSKVARCNCPWVLGTTSLIPAYQILITAFWLTIQSGCVGFGKNVLSYGRCGALALIEASGGGIGMAIAGSMANPSPIIWKPLLAAHTMHLFVIIARCVLSRLSINVLFHESFFAYINSGAVSFLIFGTVGAAACEALVTSISHRVVERSSMAAALQALRNRDVLHHTELQDLAKARKFRSEFHNRPWESLCKSFGTDQQRGFDTQALRKYLLLCSPFYDTVKAKELQESAGIAYPWLSTIVPELLIVGDFADHITQRDMCYPTLLVRGNDRNGSPAWVCEAPSGRTTRLFAENGDWILDVKAYEKYERRFVALGGADRYPEVPAAGLEWLKFPTETERRQSVKVLQPKRQDISVRPASIADVRACPLLPIVILKAKVEKGAISRLERSHAVLLLVALLSPIWATYLLPGALAYFFIIVPLAAASLFLIAAVAGVGEMFEDITFGEFELKAQGNLRGYWQHLSAGQLHVVYAATAKMLRGLPDWLRLALMNVGLAGLTLTIQMSCNYAILNFIGHTYWQVPADEFAARSLHCELCTIDHSIKDLLSFGSWFL